MIVSKLKNFTASNLTNNDLSVENLGINISPWSVNYWAVATALIYSYFLAPICLFHFSLKIIKFIEGSVLKHCLQRPAYVTNPLIVEGDKGA